MVPKFSPKLPKMYNIMLIGINEFTSHFQIGLCSSVECKGIIGNDGRHYILDLLRTFPPDVNFLEEIEGMGLSREARALGFPIVHKHKLSCLR